MVDLSKRENFGLLMSAKALNQSFKMETSIDNSVSELEIILLSIISYHERESAKLMSWVYSYLAKNKKQRTLCKKYSHITSRAERLWLWKKVLNKKYRPRKTSYSKSLSYICKIMIASNDNYVRGFKFESELSNISIVQYRDNYLMQFIRSYYIFLNSDLLESYRELFKGKYGFSLKDYLYVIYTTVYRCYEFPEIDYFNPYDVSVWKIRINDEFYINAKPDLVRNVLDSISISLNDTSDLGDDSRNMLDFCNQPLLKLNDETYIPIDGKLFEDILFHNLFYKLLDMTPKKFMSDFGGCFENYVTRLITKSCALNASYEFIPEFKYNKNQNKSPDAIIYNSDSNTALVVEVKSARVLHSLLVRDDNNKSFDLTVEKLLIKPWEQALKSTSEIVGKGLNSRLNAKTSFFFLNVTMNDIAMYPLNISINYNGADVRERFFSMNIEAFELFMEILSKEFDYCFGSILEGFLKVKDRMSIKTYLSRIREGTYGDKAYKNEHFRSQLTEGVYDLMGYLRA